ncbi:MAG: ComF family protein [Pseudomonadota bacterium]|nr:ComF family protein [Pseudomonadota bacterium]
MPRGFETAERLLGALADVLFPPRCQSCGRTSGALVAGLFCPVCGGDIRYIAPPVCPVCGAPGPAGQTADRLCEDCRRAPKPFAVARSLAVYAGPLLRSIHDFKYRRQPGLGRRLGRLIIDNNYAGMELEGFDVVVPVPLHVRRLRERGFNQSLLLARTVAAGRGIPVDFVSLRRERDTPPQTAMGRNERRVNIRGAFAVVRRDRLRDRGVLLVDDVYTTGSTLGECARTLLEGGAARVGVLTLARALPETPEAP